MPIPAANHNFDEASIGARYGLRPELKPIRISQPAGVNFRFDGNFIEWQKWRFHTRFERRSGPVISLVTYDRRQVLYQGSLAEIFVPYQDPGANWFYRTYMDAGEFGFGLLASPLQPGLDLPDTAVLLDAPGRRGDPRPDPAGDPAAAVARDGRLRAADRQARRGATSSSSRTAPTKAAPRSSWSFAASPSSATTTT